MPGWIDLTLKLLATLIAAFGIWKYFAERDAAVTVDAQGRALGYIERFGDSDIIAARATLLDFWRDHPEYLAYIDAYAVTERVRANFVQAVYPQRPDRTEIDAALFRMVALFDEVAYCREAGICDPDILDGFFCVYASRFSEVYAPFFALLSEGMAPIDAGLRRFAEACATE